MARRALRSKGPASRPKKLSEDLFAALEQELGKGPVGLDALPVDKLEEQRVVDECRTAFAFNSRVFAELGREFLLAG